MGALIAAVTVVSVVVLLWRPQSSPGVLAANAVMVEVIHASLPTVVQYLPWLVSAAVVLLLALKRNPRLPDFGSPLVLLAFLYTVWLMVTAIVHRSTGDLKYAAGVPIVMAVLFWAIPNLTSGLKPLRQVLGVAAVATALFSVTAGIAALKFHSGFPVPVGHRTLLAWQWPFANKNTLGFLAAFGVPSAVALALSCRTWQRWLWWPVAAISSVGMLMCYARTSWIAVLVGVVVLAIGYGRWKGLLLIVLLGLVGGGALVVKTGVHRLIALWGHGLSGRVGLWKAAVKVVSLHPILGVGPGNSPAAMAPFVGLAFRGLTPSNAFLETLVELGIIGLVLMLGLIVTSFVRAVGTRMVDAQWRWIYAALLLAGLTEQMAESGFIGGISFEDYLFAAILASVLAWDRGRAKEY